MHNLQWIFYLENLSKYLKAYSIKNLNDKYEFLKMKNGRPIVFFPYEFTWSTKFSKQ